VFRKLIGFRKAVVEKPLAVDEQDLAAIDRLRRWCNLDLMVLAPWLVSALTHRILQTLRGGELGALRSVFVVLHHRCDGNGWAERAY
jgi:predicted dehydrogenase